MTTPRNSVAFIFVGYIRESRRRGRDKAGEGGSGESVFIKQEIPNDAFNTSFTTTADDSTVSANNPRSIADYKPPTSVVEASLAKSRVLMEIKSEQRAFRKIQKGDSNSFVLKIDNAVRK